MKAGLCCIAKNENNYIREWVDYHLKLGFCKIFIYDNNDIYGEIFTDILHDHLSNQKVEVINCRGKIDFQALAYSDCYLKYGDVYDWIAFLDVDEFLTFPENSSFRNINDYFEFIDNKDFNLIHVNWMCFGDNNIVECNTYNVLSRFNGPLDYNLKIDYDFPENFHVKSIVKGGLEKITFDNVHTPLDPNLKVCNGDGMGITENTPFIPYTFRTIYIRHYVTKTISEWIQKIKRGRSDGYYLNPVNKFFLYNEKNKEKEFIINQYLKSFKSLESEPNFNISDPNISEEEKVLCLERQIDILKKEINKIKSSKSYRLGKLMLKPYSKIRQLIGNK